MLHKTHSQWMIMCQKTFSYSMHLCCEGLEYGFQNVTNMEGVIDKWHQMSCFPGDISVRVVKLSNSLKHNSSVYTIAKKKTMIGVKTMIRIIVTNTDTRNNEYMKTNYILIWKYWKMHQRVINWNWTRSWNDKRDYKCSKEREHIYLYRKPKTTLLEQTETSMTTTKTCAMYSNFLHVQCKATSYKCNVQQLPTGAMYSNFLHVQQLSALLFITVWLGW